MTTENLMEEIVSTRVRSASSIIVQILRAPSEAQLKRFRNQMRHNAAHNQRPRKRRPGIIVMYSSPPSSSSGTPVTQCTPQHAGTPVTISVGKVQRPLTERP